MATLLCMSASLARCRADWAAEGLFSSSESEESESRRFPALVVVVPGSLSVLPP